MVLHTRQLEATTAALPAHWVVATAAAKADLNCSCCNCSVVTISNCTQHTPELREVQVARCLCRCRRCHVPARRRAVGPLWLQQAAQQGQRQRQLQDERELELGGAGVQTDRQQQCRGSTSANRRRVGGGSRRRRSQLTSAALQPRPAILHFSLELWRPLGSHSGLRAVDSFWSLPFRCLAVQTDLCGFEML